MLVFGRKKNEQVVIDEDIVITVVAVRGERVRLGIEAPRGVSVHRREVYDAIHQAIAADAAISPDDAWPRG